MDSIVCSFIGVIAAECVLRRHRWWLLSGCPLVFTLRRILNF